MTDERRAYFIGGGIGSLAGAAFMIRDGGFLGSHITIYESAARLGGSLDGAGDSVTGYSMRGGRMFTTDNYECTWDLYKSIPSLLNASQSVYQETVAFNEKHPTDSRARLVDRHRGKVPVESMGFSMHDRMELIALYSAEENILARTCITDWLSPGFFDTAFWLMWATTFAFQPWHSAVEFKRYLHRFVLEFSRINTLSGVKRTIFNQYDSLVLPLQAWLSGHGVHLATNCRATSLDHEYQGGRFVVTGIRLSFRDSTERQSVHEDDCVFLQNGSMTDASSVGSMTSAPRKQNKESEGDWALWQSLAEGRPQFGNPKVFNHCIAQSYWESFTVTLRNTAFFDSLIHFSGNEPGTGGLVTFKDSNWLMSIVLAHQPHFANQPSDVQVFWGYALFPDRIGNFVPSSMTDCNGSDILKELCGHLRFDLETVTGGICIPCRMPYITSMFMPREMNDRPPPVPHDSKNLAFISQFVEIADDVVFTVEYSVRAAQMAVYALLGIDRRIPPVTAHDKSIHAQFDAVLKAFK
jgi:oleate hydratase